MVVAFLDRPPDHKKRIADIEGRRAFADVEPGWQLVDEPRSEGARGLHFLEKPEGRFFGFRVAVPRQSELRPVWNEHPRDAEESLLPVERGPENTFEMRLKEGRMEVASKTLLRCQRGLPAETGGKPGNFP